MSQEWEWIGGSTEENFWLCTRIGTVAVITYEFWDGLNECFSFGTRAWRVCECPEECQPTRTSHVNSGIKLVGEPLDIDLYRPASLSEANNRHMRMCQKWNQIVNQEASQIPCARLR